MGTGGAKAHESFGISTTSNHSSAGEPPAASGPPEVSGADAALAELADWVPSADHDLAGNYDELAQKVATAKATLDEEHHSAIASAANHALNQLSPEELQQLAGDHGFEHPTLVGLSGSDAHPLAHWLNPAYPDDDPSKAKIALKAQERYAELAAGGTINGLTLADLPALNETAGPDEPWQATAGDIIVAQADVQNAMAKLASSTDPSGDLTAVIDAENRLAGATNAELADQLAVARAAARVAVNDAIAPHVTNDTVGPLVAAAQANGALPPDTAKVLTASEAVTLLRKNIPAEERAGINSEHTSRVEQVAKLDAAAVELAKAGALPATIADPASKSAFFDHAQHLAEYLAVKDQVAGWQPHVLDPASMGPALAGEPSALAASYSTWSKAQKLKDLREVAGELGLEHAKHASRKEATSWIEATWNQSLAGQKAAIAASVADMAPKPAPVAKAPAPSAPPAAAMTTPAPGSFAAKHLALVANIKHHLASTAALPTRQPAAAIAQMAFTDGPVQAVGGAHTKSFHTAPDGSVWMFKPDKSAGGARAHAEAAASDVFARVGVPAVPVYARHLNGYVGSIQPIVPKTSDLSPAPSSWSQADVDAMVRLHVAAWAIGDHDSKHDNILRTSSGGMVPIDQGQAFKFYGQDTLSTSYHPNASYGAARPVYHQAYLAAKTGNLAPGVQVRPESALPVIKAFEALPDHEYRQMLHRTAHDGAKNGGVHWFKTMHARAATRLGKANPTADDVATEFLDHAVARKNTLRSAFADFFASEGMAGHHQLTKVV